MLGRDFNSRGMETCRGSIPPLRRSFDFIFWLLTLSSAILLRAAIAQLAARRSHNPKVVSSILTRCTRRSLADGIADASIFTGTSGTSGNMREILGASGKMPPLPLLAA